MMTADTTKNQEAIEELKTAGVVLEKKENRFGETKSGWWLDGVYLAPRNKPADAVRVMKGN